MRYFNEKNLLNLLKKDKSKFINAQPFPHIIIDNFLDNKEALELANKFPGIKDKIWEIHGSGANPDSFDFEGVKRGSSNIVEMPKEIRQFLLEFNSEIFLQFLRKLSGVKHIIGDPSFSGCGLHSTGKGGRLMIHSDVNRYPIDNFVYQYLNCIFYITKDWDPSWNGNLELWDKKCKKCIKSIQPKFNRMIIFETTPFAFHGHPKPLNIPITKRRNSIAAYFYIPRTIYSSKYLSNELKTVFWRRTQSQDKLFSYKFLKDKFNLIMLEILPPIISKSIQKIKRKRLNKK